MSFRGKCGKNISWEYQDGTLVFSGTGEMNADDYLLYEPHDHWFANHDGYHYTPWQGEGDGPNKAVKRVVIGSGIVSVGESAFGETEVSWRDRDGNYLGGSNQFPKIASVQLPEGLKRIENNAFYHCISLSEVHIPSSLEHIGSGAFSGTPFLDSVEKNEGLTVLGKVAFQYRGTESCITIPKGVETLNAYLFHNYKTLKHIRLPETLKTIEEYAFDGCEQLESIDIPPSVEAIGDRAFSCCKKLRTIRFPGGLRSIGRRAFGGCDNLETIELPDTLENVDDEAFVGVESLLSVRDGFLVAGSVLYRYTGKNESVRIPDDYTSVSESAFKDTKIISLSLPNADFIGEKLCFQENGGPEELFIGDEAYRFSYPVIRIERMKESILCIFEGRRLSFKNPDIVRAWFMGNEQFYYKKEESCSHLVGKGWINAKELIEWNTYEYIDVGDFQKARYRLLGSKLIVHSGVELINEGYLNETLSDPDSEGEVKQVNIVYE